VLTTQRRSIIKVLATASLALLALPAARPAAAGVLTGNCRMANQPAATLLVPFFQLDVDDPNAWTTLFSVNNASAKPALARVVLWTDWGVPTLAFDIYLTGYDVQTLNVRDLFNGLLPTTGAGVSNQGPFSVATPDFPGCDTAPGASPEYGRPALTPSDRAYLRAAHTGQPLPSQPPGAPQCAGSGAAGPGRATGYITVDAVNRCNPVGVAGIENTPADGRYFVTGGTGIASNSNVLWGDFYYVNPGEHRSESQAAVHLVADADFFGPGDYTFYGRYVGFDSRDNRVPLSSLYYVRFLNGGPFTGGTDLVVWRDNRDLAVDPSPCGTGPAWAPLGENQLVVFDEEENGTQLQHSNAFPLATQLVHVGDPVLPTTPNFGWLMLDLWHGDGTHGQAYVQVMMTAAGRFSVGHEAVRADDMCNFGP